MRSLRSREFLSTIDEDERERLAALFELAPDSQADEYRAYESTELGERVARDLEDTSAVDALLSLAVTAALTIGGYESDEEPDLDRLAELGVCAIVDGEVLIHEPLLITAIAAQSRVPMHLGCLLHRVSDEDFARTCKAWNLGAKTSYMEQLLSLRDRMLDREAFSTQIATLRVEDREPLERALGVEPDEKIFDVRDCDNPVVSLAEGRGGELGLLLESEAYASGGSSFVPLELRELLRERLQQVPAAPDDITRRRRRSYTRSGGGRSRSESRPTLEEMEVETEDPKELAEDIGRSVSLSTASAIVELPTARQAQIAMNDKELGAAVLDILEDTLVVLRASVDVDDWVQRLAVRLEDE